MGELATRNPGASVFIPSGNESYNAALYDPTIMGANKYWRYATRSNTAPGNQIGGLPNQANYTLGNPNDPFYSVTQSSIYDPNQNYLTDVGSFSGSASYYGTYDQSGNVLEWTEGIGPNGPGDHNIDGGGWDSPAQLLRAFQRASTGNTGEGSDAGFRLVSIEPVPEPTGTLTGLLCLGLAAMRRRRRSAF